MAKMVIYIILFVNLLAHAFLSKYYTYFFTYSVHTNIFI
jgi:hypothetical protein